MACQPAANPSGWSNLPSGTLCGHDGGLGVCSGGGCVTTCMIDGGPVGYGAPDPNAKCQSCQPRASTTTWTTSPYGASCDDAGSFCNDAGTCIDQCSIGASSYPEGTADPSDPCQSCQVRASTTGWTADLNGAICADGGTFCTGGSCTGTTTAYACTWSTCPWESEAPSSLAFDGSNLWSAGSTENPDAGHLGKLVVSAGTYSTITAGTGPAAVTFDGTSLWVANYGSASVMKINVTSDAASAPITVNANPVAILSAASYIWIAGDTMGSASALQRLDPNTDAVATVGDNYSGQPIVWDGTHIWSAGRATLEEIDPYTGNVVNTYASALSNEVCTAPDGGVCADGGICACMGCGHVGGGGGIAYDGSGSLWYTSGDNNLLKVSTSTGARVATLSWGTSTGMCSSDTSITAVTSDGTYIWVAMYSSTSKDTYSLVQLLPSTGATVGTYTLSSAPGAILAGGGNLWVAEETGVVSFTD